MKKERIAIWGTGVVALRTFKECATLNQYEIIGFIDNNSERWGDKLFGAEVYSPEFLFDNSRDVDKIVILTNSFDDIKNQIVQKEPVLESIIENKNYFYKRSILKRYKNSDDIEIRNVLNYLNNHCLRVFNYDYVDMYNNLNPEVKIDTSKGLFYVIHNGKKMYFSRRYKDPNSVKKYYNAICSEQDTNSPHRYITDSFRVNKGDVIIDAGVAEGNFGLEVVEDAKRLYLIEADPLWVEALEYTFEPYKDKVQIIQKYASSYDEGDFARIDTLVNESVNFIKMDIEGSEWDALQGASDTIRRSDNIRIAACCYHSDFDQILIEDFFDKNRINHETSKGYMWFPYTVRQTAISTRLTRGIVRGEKSISE